MKVKLTAGPHEGETLDMPTKQALAALGEGWAEPPKGMQLVTEQLEGPEVNGYKTYRPGATYMTTIVAGAIPAAPTKCAHRGGASTAVPAAAPVKAPAEDVGKPSAARGEGSGNRGARK